MYSIVDSALNYKGALMLFSIGASSAALMMTELPLIVRMALGVIGAGTALVVAAAPIYANRLSSEQNVQRLVGLVENGQAYSEAIACTRLSRWSGMPLMRIGALRLFTALVLQGQAIPEAIAAALQGSRSDNVLERAAALALLIVLVHQGQQQVYAPARFAALLRTGSAYPQERAVAEQLVAALAEQGVVVPSEDQGGNAGVQQLVVVPPVQPGIEIPVGDPPAREHTTLVVGG